jgi:CheY-like chemotaxis protein
MQMPIMDGLEATRRIRSIEHEEGRPHTRIVAMTANASEDAAASCFEAGMDDHVVKPFDADDLFARLEAVELRRAS